MYSETTVRIFNFVKSGLQGVLEFTPVINLITHFLILSICKISSSHTPPQCNIIIYKTEEGNGI